MADRPPFPGAIAASHLRVYDTEAPDGLAGGTPHLHTACTEAYWVVAGSVWPKMCADTSPTTPATKWQ